ncbi:MAG: hypothetical protein HOV81_26560 [Kofleriaceae bacterium]|nr:hypothetical protein [Kofleriaceae bacterium]
MFPLVGRASAVLGVTFGRGVVYEQGQPIGTATITELTIGVQVGGQMFSELLLFPNPESLKRLKSGEFAFAANASAAIVKAAASGTSDFHGVVARAYALGGMLLELSIGGQKINFKPEQEGKEEGPQEETEARRRRAEGQRSTEQWRPAEADERQPAESRGGDGQQAVDDSERMASSEEPDTEEPDTEEPEAEEEEQPRARAGARFGIGLKRRASSLVHRAGTFERLLPKPLRKGEQGIRRRFAHAYKGLKDEQAATKVLHPESQAALTHLIEKEEGLKERLEKAAGFAIFPSVGKASAVLGATYGRGEVYEKGKLIGYAAIIQVTLGVQLGGETFAALVIFDTPDKLKRFKQSPFAFAANAAAVIVRAGASATRGSPGKARLAEEGGMLVEASLGATRFVYRKAALTRGKTLNLEAPAAS